LIEVHLISKLPEGITLEDKSLFKVKLFFIRGWIEQFFLALEYLAMLEQDAAIEIASKINSRMTYAKKKAIECDRHKTVEDSQHM
jgi:hypothetical protein